MEIRRIERCNNRRIKGVRSNLLAENSRKEFKIRFGFFFANPFVLRLLTPLD